MTLLMIIKAIEKFMKINENSRNGIKGTVRYSGPCS